MIHISHQTRSIVTPYSAQLGNLFPHGQRFDLDGMEMIVVPHGLDETKLLNNIGYEIPPPILEHYDFPSADGKKAFHKQLLTSVSMTTHPRSFVLNSMGTGKTKSCIWSFHFLKKIKRAHKMLVVSPLSTLHFVWEREVLNTIPSLKVAVLTGTAERRHRLLADESVDIYIVNHDGLRVIAPQVMLRPDIDVICFDEAAAYRNARAVRSKVARAVARSREFVWGMTGSPTPSEPTDSFGLAQLVTPDKAPRSYVQFRAELMLQVSPFRWVPKRDAAEKVSKVLSPAVRFTLDEIIELPPMIEREVQVEMGARQKKAYDDLKRTCAVLLKEGRITAVNGGVLYGKLLQTSIGWLYDNNGKAVGLDNTNRVEALIDIIEAVEDKVIVFSPYISSRDGVNDALTREKIDHASVSGDTSSKERAEIFQAFQATDKYKVLSAHPECMSHGLTLTAASTIVWFGPTTKLETFEQANARIRRIGQTRKQQIIKLVSTDAERLAYRRLAAKQDLQDHVLDIIAELTGATP